MKFVLRMVVSAAVIFGVAYLSGDRLLQVDGPEAALWAALVLAVANAFVRPVVKILSLPITILTLGLFALVVNALMIYLVAWVVPGVHTTGFIATVIAAIIISAVTSLFSSAIDKD
ncbi:MAG: phage holin family protein [Coriobacteriia bacterium]|nr:phage holin family protein [Coriobacteriia bacterium]